MLSIQSNKKPPHAVAFLLRGVFQPSDSTLTWAVTLRASEDRS